MTDKLLPYIRAAKGRIVKYETHEVKCLKPFSLTVYSAAILLVQRLFYVWQALASF